MSRLSTALQVGSLVLATATLASLAEMSTHTVVLGFGLLALQGGAVVASGLGGRKQDPLSDPAPPPDEEGAQRVRQEHRPRILVVDDEPKLRGALVRALSSFNVSTATSGNEAQRLLTDDAAFDAVICDVTMDDGSGLELLEWIGANRPRLGRRVIFLTGASVRGPVGRFLSKTCHPVLEKPVEMADLLGAIRTLTRAAE